MNEIRRMAAVVATLAVVGSGLCLWAWADSVAIPYPEGYRRWAHVKSTLVGPASPGFARGNGGLHHFYANEKALEGYRTGEFPDGAVLIDDLLEVSEDNGVTVGRARRRVAVMVRDREKFRETGGWGYEVFRGDGQAASLDPEGKATCFTCHANAPRQSVFSEYRP